MGRCYHRGMYSLLATSFAVIARKSPKRSFLTDASLGATLGLYLLTLLVSGLEMFFTPPGSGGVPYVAGVMAYTAASVATFLLTLVIGMWVINRYAPSRFTFKEMFVLQTLLTSGSSIVYAIAGILFSFGGAALGILMFVFGIYMLLTWQRIISEIASISKTQAAYVILAPVAVFIVAWLGFLLFAGAGAWTVSG